MGWEGTEDGGIDFEFSLAGDFSAGSWTPQEFVAWRITVELRPELQLLELHQIFGDELPGLFIYEVVLPTYTQILLRTSQIFSSMAQLPVTKLMLSSVTRRVWTDPYHSNFHC